MLAFLGLPGGYEWIVILVVALLIFGSRLPLLMRGAGKGVVEFKKGLSESASDDDAALKEGAHTKPED